jgi:hypothetical protein
MSFADIFRNARRGTCWTDNSHTNDVEAGFAEAVDAKMTFIESTADVRPNLMNA